METTEIKAFYAKASQHDRTQFDHAILDRLKKDWANVPQPARELALALAKKHNRLEEFSNC